MSVDILNQLPELQPHSDKYLIGSFVERLNMYLQYTGANPSQLVDPVLIANANWAKKPKRGAASLVELRNRHAPRKIMKLDAGQENNFTYDLNTALLGGESYPVLTTVLGTAGGVASFGGGLIFAAATTAIDINKPSRRILARRGDELWQVEEIGKVQDDTKFKAVHVNSYWLLDPYRGHAAYNKGWLLHEERTDVILE